MATKTGPGTRSAGGAGIPRPSTIELMKQGAFGSTLYPVREVIMRES